MTTAEIRATLLSTSVRPLCDEVLDLYTDFVVAVETGTVTQAQFDSIGQAFVDGLLWEALPGWNGIVEDCVAGEFVKSPFTLRPASIAARTPMAA